MMQWSNKQDLCQFNKVSVGCYHTDDMRGVWGSGQFHEVTKFYRSLCQVTAGFWVSMFNQIVIQSVIFLRFLVHVDEHNPAQDGKE